MGRKCALVIAFGLVVPLCGCGGVDSGLTFLPESFRQPAPKAEIEQPPDVHLIVRSNLSAIFMAAASPSNISVSFGTQTYLVNIEHDQISQREHVMALIGAPRKPISRSDAGQYRRFDRGDGMPPDWKPPHATYAGHHNPTA